MGFVSWIKGGDTVAFHHDTSLEQIISSALFNYGNLYSKLSLSVAAIFRARQLLADSISALPVVTSPDTLAPAPNSTQDWQQVTSEAMLSLQENGDAYFRITQDGFKVLPYEGMVVGWSETKKINRRRVYTFENQAMRTTGLTPNLLVVSMNRGAEDLTGLGWMESGAIPGIIAIDQYAKQYFENNGTPSGVLKVPGTLTSDEAKLLKAQWDSNHQQRSTAVISSAMDYTATSFSAQDSAWVDSHLTSIGDVSNLSGVPAFLLAYSPPGSTQDYQNVESVLVRLWRETLFPTYGKRLSEAYTALLQTQVKFDPSQLFVSSMINRSNSAALLVGAGYDPGDVADTVGLPQMSFEEVSADVPAI
jgi:HK97 family phage portal protein